MDEGTTREVRLHCTPQGHFRFEISAGSESAVVPIESDRLQEVLESRDVRIESPSYQLHLAHLSERISFSFQGHVSVYFVMTRNQFAVLTKNLGQVAVSK